MNDDKELDSRIIGLNVYNDRLKQELAALKKDYDRVSQLSIVKLAILETKLSDYENMLKRSLQWIEHTGFLYNIYDTRTCGDKYDGCFKCEIYKFLGEKENANDKKDEK